MMESISNMIKIWNVQRRRKQFERRLTFLKRQVDENIQVKEFKGKLYISYGNYPLVQQDDLCGDIKQVVANARDNWINYYLKSNKNINDLN